jgi:hypothetical protein
MNERDPGQPGQGGALIRVQRARHRRAGRRPPGVRIRPKKQKKKKPVIAPEPGRDGVEDGCPPTTEPGGATPQSPRGPPRAGGTSGVPAHGDQNTPRPGFRPRPFQAGFSADPVIVFFFFFWGFGFGRVDGDSGLPGSAAARPFRQGPRPASATAACCPPARTASSRGGGPFSPPGPRRRRRDDARGKRPAAASKRSGLRSACHWESGLRAPATALFLERVVDPRRPGRRPSGSRQHGVRFAGLERPLVSGSTGAVSGTPSRSAGVLSPGSRIVIHPCT